MAWTKKQWIEDIQNIQSALYRNCLYDPDRVRRMVDELQEIIHKLETIENYKVTSEENHLTCRYQNIANEHYIKNAKYWS